ncbi:hypothetical protein ASE49_12845 [Novosphingobium sp. Leaf2]|nr:hypothetical protein ASE49_12845 [Novosphingobium sp. Leaf2]
MMSETESASDIAALTVQLLSAYLANNTIASDDLAGLIRSTRAALTEEAASPVSEPAAPTYTPAVSVRKSLASPDHIISLVDGKPYKTLKRHLATHGLTPAEYRERYGLPASYPMVAPTFAARRREIAEKIGLGGRRRTAVAQSAAAEVPAAPPAPAKSPKLARKAPAAKADGAKPAAASTPKAEPAASVKAKRASKPSTQAAAAPSAKSAEAASGDKVAAPGKAKRMARAPKTASS